MKSPLQVWSGLSLEVQYEIKSFVRTFFTGFLIDIVAQPNLTKAVLVAAAGAALRSATKSVLPQGTSTSMTTAAIAESHPATNSDSHKQKV